MEQAIKVVNRSGLDSLQMSHLRRLIRLGVILPMAFTDTAAVNFAEILEDYPLTGKIKCS